MAEEGEGDKLERGISLYGAIALLFGSIIGAGVFVTIGPLTGNVGPAIFLSFIIAAIPPVFIALYNVQLAGTLPITGSDYVSSSRTLSPTAGWIAGYSGILASITSIGLLGYAFGGFMQELVSSVPQIYMGFGIILLFFLINLLGVRLTAKIQLLLFVSLVIVPLIIFIVGGFSNIQPELHNPLFPNGVKPVLIMAVGAAQSYVGVTTISGWAGEVENARKNVPLALGVSIAATVTIFVLVSWVLTGVMPWEQAGESVAAVPEAAMSFLPSWLGSVVFIGAIFAIVTSINGTILVNSRLVVALARDEVLPKPFARVNDKFKTPHWALLFTTTGGLIGASLGFGIEQYAIILVMFMMLLHIITSTSVYYLPDKMPDLYKKSPFKFGKKSRVFIWLAMAGVGIFFIIFGLQESTLIGPFFFGLLGAGLAYWYIRKYYLKQKGVDLEKQMKELTKEEKEEIKSV